MSERAVIALTLVLATFALMAYLERDDQTLAECKEIYSLANCLAKFE